MSVRLILKAVKLDASSADLLKSMIVGTRSNRGVDALIDHVRGLGAVMAVVEEPYTDLDYSSDYVGFYAAAFKDYPRHTRRIHLFAQDVSDILEGPFSDQEEAFRSRDYLGFVVVRPISQGPVGRTVLRFPSVAAHSVRPAARADFHVHLLGSQLSVKGAPFIQQEARVGSCAQAAIWMASLAVHARYRRTAWHSVSEITRLATTPTDAILSQALPAGSSGLNPMHMIRALHAMGHQPLSDLFRDEPDRPAPPAIASMVLRYLDSGLPVLLSLDTVDHAVCAVGYVETHGQAVRAGQTYDVFVRAFVVHDDQRGPYRLMPITQADVEHLPADRVLSHVGKPLTVEEVVAHMFVPLPKRVLLRADRADTVAQDFLSLYVRELAPRIEPELGRIDHAAAEATSVFCRHIEQGGLVRRTYLTSAARYRHYLAQTDVNERIKADILDRVLPHYVWVTEVMEPGASQRAPDGPRSILGHLVVNATSSSSPESDLLFAHVPHVVVHRDVNPPVELREQVDFVEEALFSAVDCPYAGRVRT